LNIKEVGIGEFYGFSVDYNHRFLLGDFSIVHNSTYCKVMQDYGEAVDKRVMHVVNLDPAVEDQEFQYACSIDIRKLITLKDVMEEEHLGPNGGLIYCFEQLLENMDWLLEELQDYADDYLLVDCPGQIELYSHYNFMNEFVLALQRAGYQVCAVYCLDSQFCEDAAKYIAGTFMCLAAMIHFEIPHVNVLTKCDIFYKRLKEQTYLNKLLKNTNSSKASSSNTRNLHRQQSILEEQKDDDDDEEERVNYDGDDGDREKFSGMERIQSFLMPDPDDLLEKLNKNMEKLSAYSITKNKPPSVANVNDDIDSRNVQKQKALTTGNSLISSSSSSNFSGQFQVLNEKIVSLIGTYSLVQFVPLDPSDNDSIQYVLDTVDMSIQYGEDLEPKEPQVHDIDDDNTILNDNDNFM